MSETKVRRSKEERIAEIDAKLQIHKRHITALEAKKNMILNPPARKVRTSVKSIIDKAKESGMTPEEIAKKLGL
jgi:hypothetical protein